MKKIMLIIVLAISMNLNAQTVQEYLKQNAASLSMAFAAGLSDGLNQTISFHYSTFKQVFPEANDQFWNPDLSWRNKYLNGDPKQGEKFPLSSTALVALTDAYHLTKTMDQSLLILSGVFIIGEKKIWWKYVIDFALRFVVYKVGFSTVYDVAFKVK